MGEEKEDNHELISEIESHLLDERLAKSAGKRPDCKEGEFAEKWIKTGVLQRFFEQNYSATLGLFEDVLDQAREMHRDFFEFLDGQKEEHREKGELAMVAILDDIGLKTRLPIQETRLSSQTFCFPKGFVNTRELMLQKTKGFGHI